MRWPFISIWITNKKANKQTSNQIEMTIVHLLCSSSGLSECGQQDQCSALLEQVSCAKIILGYMHHILRVASLFSYWPLALGIGIALPAFSSSASRRMELKPARPFELLTFWVSSRYSPLKPGFSPGVGYHVFDSCTVNWNLQLHE